MHWLGSVSGWWGLAAASSLQDASTHSDQGLPASSNSPYHRCMQLEELLKLLQQYPGVVGAAYCARVKRLPHSCTCALLTVACVCIQGA